MKIVTTYTSRPNSNVGKIVAKCGGKQKSTTVDQSKSSDWNHGNAAGDLLIRLGYEPTSIPANAFVYDIDNGHVRHTTNDSGTVHTFEV